MNFGHARRADWAFDPDVLYLNHGTVGATPRRVQAARRALLEELERQPATFLLRELTGVRVGGPRPDPPRMRVAAAAVASFLGARADDLAFVDNSTTGANAVMRSFPLGPGDEVLVTELGYGGVSNAARHAARDRGASFRQIAVPEPWRGPERILERLEAEIGAATRILVVDHLTSGTALVLPIAEIVALCRRRGVAVLVDGAHAPASLDLRLPEIGADWYVGNLHKWAWAPISSGILWAAPERQATLHPAVVSWGLDQGLAMEFDLPGTRDPTPHLAAPEGIAMLREWGVAAVREWNHRLAWQAAHLLAERWGTRFEAPESMIAGMAAIPLPASVEPGQEAAERLRDRLLHEDGIEVLVKTFQGRTWIRISAQVYNELADFERLGEAVARKIG